MTSPLERAARAAQEADGAYAHESGMWMKEGGLVTDSHWNDIARAVLTAIREPSEEMLVAGITAPNYLEDQSSRRGCGNIYAAMIDAALAEQ